MYKRTYTCGELRKSHVGETVNLNGWVNTVRLHGQIVFVDLRDRYGKTQIVFNEETNKESFDKIKPLGLQDVIGITGKVVSRPNDAINKDIPTGDIDVEVSDVEIYNEASPMPFDVNDRSSAMEDHRFNFYFFGSLHSI